MSPAKAHFLLCFSFAAILSDPCVLSQESTIRKSRELTVQGGRLQHRLSLRIWAAGHQGGVTVRDEQGNTLQTLSCPLLRDNPEPQEQELAAERDQFINHFLINDFDFDGYLDLAGVREFGAKWERYCVWLYDPKQQLFIRDFLAEQMELLPNLTPLDARQLSSSYPGPTAPWIALYKIVESEGARPQRQLMPLCSCLFDSAPDGNTPTTVSITRYNGTLPLVERRKTTKLDMRNALRNCDLNSGN